MRRERFKIMPLTPSGKKVLASFKKQYGTKKGTNYFYASINAGKLKASKMHRVGRRKR